MKMPVPGKKRSQHFWGLPVNNQTLHDAVLVAMKGNPTVQTPSLVSPYVTIELLDQIAEHRLILHILNYNHAKSSPVNNIPISVAIPGNRKIKQIQMLSPDQFGEVQQLQWTKEDTVNFTVPSLRVYTVVVLDLM